LRGGPGLRAGWLGHDPQPHREGVLSMAKRLGYALLGLLVLVVSALLSGARADAQQGDRIKIVAIQLSVRHRVGPTGNFVKSTVGALLPPGSRVQTGARSKCALQFPNGGVIRMDARSDLVIQSASGTSMQLSGGRLWAKVIAGTTARVQGSRGVAVVKGTEWTFDGASVTCYDGDVTFETDAGATNIPPGYQGRADAEGAVTIAPAPARQYPGGDLIQWFGGLREGEAILTTPGSPAGIARKERDSLGDRMLREAVTPSNGTLNVIVQGDTVNAHAARVRAAEPQAVLAHPGRFPGLDPNTLAPVTAFRSSLSAPALSAGATGQVPQLPDRQYFFGPYTPADTFAYLAEGGSTFGLRVRPHVVWGSVYAEVGATVRASTWYGDGTDITEAFAQLRQDWGEVTLGRQRFLKGPVNNSRLGSILTFETGDAARFSTDLDNLAIDLAYVRKMSPVIGPTSRGWYARAEYPVLNGLAAVNLVSHEGQGGAGCSLDAALPAIEDTLDLYGEVGRDAFDRNLYTVGLYFPGLYQQEELDLFVEYADRQGAPGLATLRVYKQFGEDVTTVFSVDKPSGGDVDFGAGVIWRFGD
jgi:hypothetical protein